MSKMAPPKMSHTFLLALVTVPGTAENVTISLSDSVSAVPGTGSDFPGLSDAA
jgi:hypothetical protein